MIKDPLHVLVGVAQLDFGLHQAAVKGGLVIQAVDEFAGSLLGSGGENLPQALKLFVVNGGSTG